MNNIQSINHISVLVSDLDKALNFYCGILGLKQNRKRPDLSFPGAWLDVGEQQIHLINCPNPDPVDNRPKHGGRDRHCALNCRNLAVIEEKLKKNHIPFSKSQSGRQALFCRDPDGNTIELIQL